MDEVQTAVDPEQNQGQGYGIAPIGHVVTVVGVEEVEINVEPQITLQTGYTWEDVKAGCRSSHK
ncbi:MAG: baseplate J/gp47 family protein [Dethiobacteria bacterium]